MSAPPNVIAQIEDSGTTHYIYQSDTELTERSYDGDLGPPELLGSAKAYTPGAYLLLGESRAFYCLNEDGILQDFRFDEEEGEWAQGKLAALGVRPAVDAEIAAAADAQDKSLYVFFQNSDGAIKAIHCKESGDWSPLENLPHAHPSDSVSMYAVSGGNVALFYTSQDNCIHKVTFNGEWADEKLAHTETESKKTSIAATPHGDGYSLQFTNARQEVWAIHDGQMALLGRWIDGVFKKDKGAEGFNDNGPKMVIRKPTPADRPKEK